MRISDWSSDVCSSDLVRRNVSIRRQTRKESLGLSTPKQRWVPLAVKNDKAFNPMPVRLLGSAAVMQGPNPKPKVKIGRAACRERVCQYETLSGGGVTLKKQET